MSITVSGAWISIAPASIEVMKMYFANRAALWTLAIAVGIPFSSLAKDNNSPASLKVDSSAIDRDVRTGHSYAAVVKKASPSVVNIYTTKTLRMQRMPQFFDDPLLNRFFGGGSRGGAPRSLTQESLGSGVIVTEDGYILTNNHVVDGADPDGVEVALADGKQKFTAKVVGTDPQTDIAVLKVDAKDLPAVTIADSDKLEVGDVVLAIGNPFNVGKSVTMGIVSALGRVSPAGYRSTDYEDFIQTDAAINPGNSGGALVDAQGRLVGINQSIVSGGSGVNSGVGFAVPSNLAKTVLQQIVENGTVKRGFLGVMIQDVTPDLARAFALPAETAGALVSDVGPDSPAAEAGIQEKDVITEVNGKKASDSAHARLMISQNLPGSKITLTILRNGKTKSVTAKLGELPSDGSATVGSNRSINSGERDGLDGVTVDDLSAAVRRESGIPNQIRGAYVTDVDSDSNAYKAGLRPGNVIQSIDRQAVGSADEAVHLSEKARGDQLLVRVWGRDGNMSGSRYITVDNTKK
jgi:serine protease Do